MNLFKKPAWRLVRVHVLMDWKDMDAFAFDTGCRLMDDGWASKLYFARYMDPVACTSYVEFKLVPLRTDALLRLWLSDRYKDVNKVDIEGFEGSDAHAEAFNMARQLRGLGDDKISDILHWCLNMTGYTYTQEIKMLSLHCASCANNLIHIETGA